MKTLKADEARDIVYEDHPDWETIEKNTDGSSRWSIYWKGIFKHIPSGEHFSVGWSVGATEQQDEAPFEYEDEVTFTRVIKKEVLREEWVPAGD